MKGVAAFIAGDWEYRRFNALLKSRGMNVSRIAEAMNGMMVVAGSGGVPSEGPRGRP